jgi:hypothetical protein
VYALGKKLTQEGLNNSDILLLQEEKRKELTAKLDSGIIDHKPSGQTKLLAKQQHMEVFKEALKIG